MPSRHSMWCNCRVKGCGVVLLCRQVVLTCLNRKFQAHFHPHWRSKTLKARRRERSLSLSTKLSKSPLKSNYITLQYRNQQLCYHTDLFSCWRHCQSVVFPRGAACRVLSWHRAVPAVLRAQDKLAQSWFIPAQPSPTILQLTFFTGKQDTGPGLNTKESVYCSRRTESNPSSSSPSLKISELYRVSLEVWPLTQRCLCAILQPHVDFQYLNIVVVSVVRG